MSLPLLTLRGVSLAYTDTPLFEQVELAVHPGDRVCLVGRNGSGKSTLLRLIAGLSTPDEGERFLQPGAKVSYLAQEPDFGEALTVAEYVAAGGAASHTVAAELDRLGVPGEKPVASLSGGEARRTTLARAFADAPDLLLLDEPTNHLDVATIEWLEGAVQRFRGGVVTISHDRAFLGTVTDRIFWLAGGHLRSHSRGFEHFEAWSEAVLEEEAEDRRQLQKTLARELVWLRQGVSARRKRNQGRLRRLHDLRAEKAEQRQQLRIASLNMRTGESSGKIVMEATGVSKAYDAPVISDLSLTVLRGDRVGIVGPNGSGKTTLLRLLLGELAPDSGRVKLGTKLTPVHFDQHRARLDPTVTVADTLTGGKSDQVVVHGRPRHVMGYLKDFLFDGLHARRPVGSLSGGERNRLLLAKVLAQPSNLLVLDEPTNDLDMDTLDLLQEMLSDYEGTLLLVSHDRDFLDRIVTSTLLFEGPTVVEYAGGYSDAMRVRRPTPRTEGSAKPREKRAGQRPKRTPKKLSFKLAHELEGLPARMEALTEEVETLGAKLADGDFYSSDPKGFAEAAARLEGAREALEAAELRWLELEELKESYST